MSQASPLKPALSELELDLLNELVLKKPPGLIGLKANAFRASNYKHIAVIEHLLNDGCIKKEGEGYIASLTVLPLLKIDAAIVILATAEALFKKLAAHYLETQERPITIDLLAQSANVSVDAAQNALAYMLQSPTWYGGYSLDIFTLPSGTLLPSEGILTLGSFNNAIAQLSEWQINNKTLRIASPILFNSVHTKDRSMKPEWITDLPPELSLLMSEIYTALAMNLRSLCAMGIRAAFDILCVEWVGDIGGFDRKLANALKLGKISQVDYMHLSTAVDVGNASAHRGHTPNDEDTITLLSICERILYGHYILPKKTDQLKSNTPSRALGQARSDQETK